jgi:hypothetical protein
MRKLITTIALLALIDTSVAIAQTTAGSRNPAPAPLTSANQQSIPEAPIGHRQPRYQICAVDSPDDPSRHRRGHGGFFLISGGYHLRGG